MPRGKYPRNKKAKAEVDGTKEYFGGKRRKVKRQPKRKQPETINPRIADRRLKVAQQMLEEKSERIGELRELVAVLDAYNALDAESFQEWLYRRADKAALE